MTDPLARFKANLRAIEDAYRLLAAQYHPAAPGKPGARVGGTTAPKLPIAVDPVDLTGPARRASMDLADTSPWPQDQIGHLPVATELDFWVADIASLVGEPKPRPAVPDLAAFLLAWAGWAWDHYGALDEMAVKVDRIARTLYALQNDRQPRPEPKAAPCPGCGTATLSGDGETVRCAMEDCGRVLTEREYRRWATDVAHRNLNGGQGMSAREIALRWCRPIGTVHRWASQYRWPKSDGSLRPVLYLREAVEATVKGVLEREERERAARAELTG